MIYKIERFKKKKKTSPDWSDLFIAESHESIVQVRYCKSGVYRGSLIEVDGKGLVSPDR